MLTDQQKLHRHLFSEAEKLIQELLNDNARMRAELGVFHTMSDIFYGRRHTGADTWGTPNPDLVSTLKKQVYILDEIERMEPEEDETKSWPDEEEPDKVEVDLEKAEKRVMEEEFNKTQIKSRGKK